MTLWKKKQRNFVFFDIFLKKKREKCWIFKN